jgi:hypothetical protein
MCGSGSYQIIPIAGIFILGETRGTQLLAEEMKM